MAGEQFLHGVEVVEIDSGPRPISTVATSIIGIVGTAPDADATAFPLNQPVLIAGSRVEAARLDMTGDGLGTLPTAIDSIFDQTGAIVVVVRVEDGGTDQATLANVLGGVDPITGEYQGVHALLAAKNKTGQQPRILVAPGFTHQRVTGGLLTLTISDGGTGYTDGVHNLTFTGGGSGIEATATVTAGTVTSVSILKRGSGYTAAPTVALAASAGAGEDAAFVATVGTVGNAVVSEMVGIAERLRAVIIADGPNTNDEDAIAYAGDFGSKRVYLHDPQYLKVDGDGAIVSVPSSPAVAGMLAKSDNERGFWWSPSNQNVNGIVGTSRSIDFAMGDRASRANLLNEAKVATTIREDGFRLWGNRTLASDPKWAFLCVVRTADIINDSLQRAHLWAVDRGITKNYVSEVQEGVNAYLRHLVSIGAILGGRCWADKDLNTPDQIAQGKVYFDFDFTPVYPAEHIIFRSHLTNDYITEVF